MAPEAHAALRDKYVEMLRMRREHLEGTAQDARAEMRSLAQRFPGALREIDELPLEEIEARVAILDEVAAGRATPPPWATFFVEYHGWMRAALRIKRMCRGCGDVATAVERVRETYRAAADEPPPERACDPAIVGAILRPPGGRLNPWIFGRIAAAHGVTAEDVGDTLFPSHHC